MMGPRGLEPLTFGSGIRRATNCAMDPIIPRPGFEPGSSG
jgi:hypothetical protein